jgi:hypothetical protein
LLHLSLESWLYVRFKLQNWDTHAIGEKLFRRSLIPVIKIVPNNRGTRREFGGDSARGSMQRYNHVISWTFPKSQVILNSLGERLFKASWFSQVKIKKIKGKEKFKKYKKWDQNHWNLLTYLLGTTPGSPFIGQVS